MAKIVTKAERWWQKPFGVVQTNLREIDAGMDVAAVADWVQHFGATAWLCSVGGIQAQYPTALDFQSCNPHLHERKSGDLVGDAIMEAKKRGLKFLARMDFSKIAPHVAAEHPEWCYMSPHGNLQEHTAGLVSVCPAGGYYQERIFDILDEIATRYPIDGLFFNWATMNEVDYFKHYHGVCHCVNCLSRWLEFEPAKNLKLPRCTEDKNYDIWLVFSRQIIDDITARMRDFIAARLPDAALIRGKTADIIYQESNNEIGRPFWHHLTSEWVSSWVAWHPKVPVLANSTCFIDMRYRMAGEEPAQFAQYLIQCISRGGMPSTYMMGTPGKIPYPCLDVAREVTQFHRKWSNVVYDGICPSALTGLVRPDRGYLGAEEYRSATAEFRGLYEALQEHHIPFDIIAMEHLPEIASNGSLDRYRNLVLPDLGLLRQALPDVFDSWVRRTGGILITTGSTGHAEVGVVQLKSLPVSRRRATVSEARLLWSSYAAPEQTVRGIHYYNGPTVPLYGASYYYDWKPESVTKGKILARAPFAPPEKAYGNLEIDQPAYGVARYGLGKAVCIPFTVGRGYYETGLSCLRDFFMQVFTQNAHKEEISFDLPEKVEVTVHQTGDSVIIHLINLTGATRVNFQNHVPIAGGAMRVSSSVAGRTVRALKANIVLNNVNGVIKLPMIDLYEVIVLDGTSPGLGSSGAGHTNGGAMHSYISTAVLVTPESTEQRGNTIAPSETNGLETSDVA